MNYVIDFQYQASPQSRPEDHCCVPIQASTPVLIPNVDDSVYLEGFRGKSGVFKVVTRHFAYTGQDIDSRDFCTITIVVKDAPPEEVELRIKE